MKQRPKLYCPLCLKQLKCQYQNESDEYESAVWCPTPIKLQYGRQNFHYLADYDAQVVEMIVMPYFVKTYNDDFSIISVHIPPEQTNTRLPYLPTNTWLFKKIIKTPAILPMEESKLLSKIKTLMLFV